MSQDPRQVFTKQKFVTGNKLFEKSFSMIYLFSVEQEQIEKILQENNDLIKENHGLLKKIHGYARRIFYMRIIYWIIVIVFALGLFYYVQPYVQNLINTYHSAVEVVEKTRDFVSTPIDFLKDRLLD